MHENFDVVLKQKSLKKRIKKKSHQECDREQIYYVIKQSSVSIILKINRFIEKYPNLESIAWISNKCVIFN